MDFDNARLLDLGMSNFDHTIDSGLDSALRSEPEKVYANYSGWNFHARVWFENDQFHAEVSVYGAVMDTVSADSLQDIMDSVSSAYGHE